MMTTEAATADHIRDGDEVEVYVLYIRSFATWAYVDVAVVVGEAKFAFAELVVESDGIEVVPPDGGPSVTAGGRNSSSSLKTALKPKDRARLTVAQRLPIDDKRGIPAWLCRRIQLLPHAVKPDGVTPSVGNTELERLRERIRCLGRTQPVDGAAAATVQSAVASGTSSSCAAATARPSKRREKRMPDRLDLEGSDAIRATCSPDARAFCDFLLETFGAARLNDGPVGVLDVAGGNGELSMLLGLAQVRSTVIDPRATAGFLPRRHRKQLRQLAIQPPGVIRAWFGVQGQHVEGAEKAPVITVAVQPSSVATAIGVMAAPAEGEAQHAEDATRQGPTDDKTADAAADGVDDVPKAGSCPEPVMAAPSFDATMDGCSVVLGLHPDEALDAIVDFAVSKRRPFAVVPCCVFARRFRHRVDPSSGGAVQTREQLCDYVQAKHALIQRAVLDTDGANVVLYATTFDA